MRRKVSVMELEVHVKLNMQVQDCTITHTVMKEAGLKRGMALGGGGEGAVSAATELCKE